MSAAKKTKKGKLNIRNRVEKISKFFSPVIERSTQRRQTSVSQGNKTKESNAAKDPTGINYRQETRFSENKKETAPDETNRAYIDSSENENNTKLNNLNFFIYTKVQLLRWTHSTRWVRMSSRCRRGRWSL